MSRSVEYNEGEIDPAEANEPEGSRRRDLTLFAALPLCLGAAVIAVTLALPGSTDTTPRSLFSNCLLNGVAAIALSGAIQMWFTMGETRRADRERSRADRERSRADKALEQAANATALAGDAAERADRAERDAAELRVQVASLTETVAELQRRLDERSNGSSRT